MSQYIGTKLKIIRRLGNLPGITTKKSKLINPPGQHGARKKKPTQYALRLEEKQKIRFNYGVSEKQLINYVKKAKQSKEETGKILLQLLEMRLDNVLFRSGFALTIPAARQLITHKHILINGHCVSIPSYNCLPGDVISVKGYSKVHSLITNALQLPTLSNRPSNLYFDKEHITIKILSVIDRQWIALKVNELLIIEYYSRKI